MSTYYEQFLKYFSKNQVYIPRKKRKSAAVDDLGMLTEILSYHFGAGGRINFNGDGAYGTLLFTNRTGDKQTAALLLGELFLFEIKVGFAFLEGNETKCGFETAGANLGEDVLGKSIRYADAARSDAIRVELAFRALDLGEESVIEELGKTGRKIDILNVAVIERNVVYYVVIKRSVEVFHQKKDEDLDVILIADG